jgi:hypothetical protein
LLSGAQRRVIETWPDAGKPVLSFQAANPTMEHLLASECCIQPGPSWLFRMGPDGQALEIVGRLVRPAQSYVLVTSAGALDMSMASLVTIRCKGVTAHRIDVPATLTAAEILELRAQGLSVAETIRVWPAGLAARGWDGEGTTEWIEGERPCFGIEHDHPAAEYEFRLGTGPSFKVPARPAGEPTFIKLEPLPAGNHVLSVAVARNGAEAATRPVEGLISLVVRPRNAWVSGSIGHAGLIATTEPTEPTLDAFWEGLTELKIMGPAGRHISVSVQLLNGTGGMLAHEHVANLQLPLGPDIWRNAHKTFVRREKAPWAHLGAAGGTIIVDGEELGIISIPLQRDVAPLRWVWQTKARSHLLRLVDDHDAETPLRVTFHSFLEPLKEVVLNAATASAGIELPTPGGLLVASHGDVRETVVVSMPRVEGGFAGLIPDCRIDLGGPAEDVAFALVKSVAAWSDARLTGMLAGDRRVHVVRRLNGSLFDLICGYNWAAAERLLDRGGDRSAAVAAMTECFEKPNRPFAIVLIREAGRYARMAGHVRQREFASLSQRYSVAPGATSKPALDLIDCLERRERLSDDVIRTVVNHLRKYPALAAGARIIHLLGNDSSISARGGLATAA